MRLYLIHNSMRVCRKPWASLYTTDLRVPVTRRLHRERRGCRSWRAYRRHSSLRLSKVIKVVGEKLQKERKHFRMMYEGSRVDDEDTIESLDAYDGDIFEVHEEQCG